jgi:DNA invertase Pin-like site-specific DNA recombinase
MLGQTFDARVSIVSTLATAGRIMRLTDPGGSEMADRSASTTKRVALYARVSTKNNGQDPETQLLALREYVRCRAFAMRGEYVDVGISGARDKRPQLDRLMTDARQGRFDVILVARFDRFARSTKHLVIALAKFQALGIDFVSLSVMPVSA